MTEEQGFFGKLQSYKTAIQIVAIFVAGGWTYWVFIMEKAPSLETNTMVERSLSSPFLRGDECLRSFSINLINTGKSTFFVNKVLTRAWKFKYERDKEKPGKIMDLYEIQETGEKIFELSFPEDDEEDEARWYPFLKKYRPNENYSHTFEFIAKKDNEAWIFIKTEIFIEGEDTPKVGGAWDRICGWVEPELMERKD